MNDNGGDGFEFYKLIGRETWVTQVAMNQSNVPPNQIDSTVPADRRALASIKQTDLLVPGITQWPQGVFATPLDVNGRAALYSFGFLLRRAAADLLDVDERELKVGLRVVREVTGQVTGQVFISDSLENGAGYSSRLGRPAEMQNLLEYVTGVNSQDFYAHYVSLKHSNDCQTSCPDCVRDFSNLAFHNILDWRLGLDLARLALDATAPIDFNVAYWQTLAVTAPNAYFHHAPAKAVLERICRGDDTGYTSAHSLAETFSVLSRMPTVPKLMPQDVLAILEQNVIPHFSLVRPVENLQPIRVSGAVLYSLTSAQGSGTG